MFKNCFSVTYRKVNVHLAITVHLELLIDFPFLVQLVFIVLPLQQYLKWIVQCALLDIIVMKRGCRYLYLVLL